jgi:acyl-[acyl-carrier-protein]-phospholipid O-acyltransferase/long-chain-fatty-acid--[acyl-carrier-protein] ligase
MLPLAGVSRSLHVLSGFGALLADAGAPPRGGWPGAGTLWLTLALILAVAALGFVCWRRPLLPLRVLVWVIAHALYRIRVHGAENVPAEGGALLVCNHVTFIDWLLLAAVQRRYIRFVVFAAYARHWAYRPFLRWAGAIPVNGEGGPKAIVQALQAAGDALERGELVCIFAEGALTRTGSLLPFHRGFEQILKCCPAPIIPVCFDELWGSVFSFHGGRAFWKWPRQWPHPVTIAYGKPMPCTSSAAEVRLAVQNVAADCAVARCHKLLPVHRCFVRTAARHPFRICFIDPNAQYKTVNYATALMGSILLSRLLRPLLGDVPMVGVWLPPSTGGAITNIALAFLGKTAVNLNYTSSADCIQSAIRQCGIRHVLTARRFTDRMKLDAGPGVEVIALEDFAPRFTWWRKVGGLAAAILLPGWFLDRCVLRLDKHRLDDLATVVFSSGSTGQPKGVMLTHANITANAASMIQAIDVRAADRLLGVLPFFHSFGYTVTLWVPLQVGASLVYYPDPRQAKEIGELCREHRCTAYVTTPTFLRFCLRRCEPNDFRSLRVLICGAEKLPPSLAEEFRARFGVLPLEGYGCTELSPVATTNVPDVDVAGTRQVGNKPGTIGQPIPGVAARVVHPDTLAPLPPDAEGLLQIYGANVMKGYLGLEERTREVVRDGWYVTGDMARIDEDGFVTITGRLARFAKIAGEMVPLQKIEEELHGILQTSDHVCAVTAVPDEKKGERIVVLHLPHPGLDVRRLSEQLSRRGLPNLGLPGERDFFPIPEMPLLGSGKLDLRRLRDLALEKVYGNGN